jgi:hypothetical protein
MALVDLSIWSDPAGGLLVVPRAPMRTVLIERGIVTFNPGVGIQVEAPATASSPATASRPRAVTAPEPDFPASLVLRWLASPEVEGRAGFVEKTGKIYFQSGAATAKRAGRPEVGERYLQSIADAVGGSIRRYERAAPEVVGADGRAIDLTVILDHARAWRQSSAELIEGLRAQDQ